MSLSEKLAELEAMMSHTGLNEIIECMDEGEHILNLLRNITEEAGKLEGSPPLVGRLQ